MSKKKKNSSTTGGVKVKIKPAELGKIVQEDIYVPDEKGGKKLLKIKPRATPKMEQEDTYLPDLYIENFENTEMPNFKKGGLVKSGKPKLAKKGWR